MNRIVFAGGDMDGKVEEFELVEGNLMYDGSGGRAFPRGRYRKTEETRVIDGVVRTVWQLVSRSLKQLHQPRWSL